MKKKQNTYKVYVIEKLVTEFDESVIQKLGPYYINAVSEKQAISRVRYEHKFYDQDNWSGSTTVMYDFRVEEIKPKHGYEQLNLFDFVND